MVVFKTVPGAGIEPSLSQELVFVSRLYQNEQPQLNKANSYNNSLHFFLQISCLQKEKPPKWWFLKLYPGPGSSNPQAHKPAL